MTDISFGSTSFEVVHCYSVTWAAQLCATQQVELMINQCL